MVPAPAACRACYSGHRMDAMLHDRPSLLATLWRHRVLLWELTRRETGERFAGSVLGSFWVIAYPVFLMALYVTIFGWIFPARMQGTGVEAGGYTVYILSGLIVWLNCAEVLNRAPGAIRGSAALVKQIVFPTEILPVRTTLAAFPTQLILTALLLVYMAAASVWHGASAFHATLLLVPVIWLSELMILSGLCAGISALCVAARDLRELVTFFTTAGLFLAPVLYPPALIDSLPWPLLAVLWLNPFSHLVWCAQDAFAFGSILHPWSWVIMIALAPTTWWLGHALFAKLSPLFGDRL